MNIKLLYVLWKSVLSQIIWYHFGVVCVHAWMKRRHCLRECKNRIAPKLPMWCLNKTIGIWILIRSLQIQITPLTKLIMPQILNIEYQISTNICARVCGCVWLCPLQKNICNAFHLIPFNPFSHSANPNIIHTKGITLAQVDFCTLANNATCSSKREHIPHKNGTKWFGIKHSFIRCIIIYCS